MSKVLIVARTRMGKNYCCIGGLDLEHNKSIRLLTSSGSNWTNSAKYEVGQIWDIVYRPRPVTEIVPPHVEDVLIQQCLGCLGKVENMKDYLLGRVKVWKGSIGKLFGEKLKVSYRGSGYLDKKIPTLPKESTGFWVSDCDLFHRTYPRGSYYCYKTRRIKFVGFQEAVDKIPSGTLLRVSLARWWRKKPESDDRCYLQLSGWY